MKRLQFLLLPLAVVFFWAPATWAAGAAADNCIQGNGAMGSEPRILDPFSRIDADGAFEIRIVCGRDQQLRIEAETNLIPHIRTRVQDRTLFIDTDRSVCARKEMRIAIAVPVLDAFFADGAIDASISDIRADRFDLTLAGSGNATVSGQVRQFSARLTGAGDLQGTGLMARSASVILAGAGQAAVYAAQYLEATIEGVGDITVHGDPEEIVEHINGVGEVIRQ